MVTLLVTRGHSNQPPSLKPPSPTYPSTPKPSHTPPNKQLSQRGTDILRWIERGAVMVAGRNGGHLRNHHCLPQQYSDTEIAHTNDRACCDASPLRTCTADILKRNDR